MALHNTHTYVCMHTCTYTHTCMHMCTHTYGHVRMCTNTHTHTHTHTQPQSFNALDYNRQWDKFDHSLYTYHFMINTQPILSKGVGRLGGHRWWCVLMLGRSGGMLPRKSREIASEAIFVLKFIFGLNATRIPGPSVFGAPLTMFRDCWAITALGPATGCGLKGVKKVTTPDSLKGDTKGQILTKPPPTSAAYVKPIYDNMRTNYFTRTFNFRVSMH